MQLLHAAAKVPRPDRLVPFYQSCVLINVEAVDQMVTV